MYESESPSSGTFSVFNIQQYCWLAEEEKASNDAYIYFSNFVWKITYHESVAVYTWLNSSEMWSQQRGNFIVNEMFNLLFRKSSCLNMSFMYDLHVLSNHFSANYDANY